jgi:hypothetical protein
MAVFAKKLAGLRRGFGKAGETDLQGEKCDPKRKEKVGPKGQPSERMAKNRNNVGGEIGIRTRGRGLCPYTRLAGERLQPTRPSLLDFAAQNTIGF